jgi:hypothetical protein
MDHSNNNIRVFCFLMIKNSNMNPMNQISQTNFMEKITSKEIMQITGDFIPSILAVF